MIAVAIHQIAIYLYKVDLDLGKHKDLLTWLPPSENQTPHPWKHYPGTLPPTLFIHTGYEQYDHYPDGVADMVGYWAEGRIFGGVVLFDRRESGHGVGEYHHEHPSLLFYLDPESLLYLAHIRQPHEDVSFRNSQVLWSTYHIYLLRIKKVG